MNQNTLSQTWDSWSILSYHLYIKHTKVLKLPKSQATMGRESKHLPHLLEPLPLVASSLKFHLKIYFFFFLR